ncbi:PQQ-dependent sugar dehydrogenase [Spirosoma koreense]
MRTLKKDYVMEARTIIIWYLLWAGLLFMGSSLRAQPPKIQLELVASGLTRPTDLAIIDANTFLVSQTDGKIRLVRSGAVQPTPFLDISAKIRDPTWEGIFGIALHPDFATNGYVYVHYSRSDLTSVFARYTRKKDNPDEADSRSEMIFLTIPYPAGGHRSGRMGFGADGYLYITTGDSSSGARGPVSEADKVAQLLAQNLQDLHGKLLRIDVNQGSPYAIPPSNPFADPNDGVRDEIYAWGLRNPWRWSFDRQTGDFWVGDIGQDGWEELNVTPATSPTPQNYGWPCFEGTHAYASNCPTNGPYHMPLLDYAGYDHNGGQSVSITGGFVYRGSAYPNLQGWYVYADYATGAFWTLKREADGTFENIAQAVGVATSPVSFGEGPNGELYVLSLGDGKLYQVSSPSPDLSPVVYARPSSLVGTKPFTVVVDIFELNGVSTSGPIQVKVSKDANVSLSFNPMASTVGGRSVANNTWNFTGPLGGFYTLTTTKQLAPGEVLSFGLEGICSGRPVNGSFTLSSVIVAGSGGEGEVTNNTAANKVDYLQP